MSVDVDSSAYSFVPSRVPRAASHRRPPFAWRRAFAFAGPGALVAVGYIDPGNWATDLAGGSHYAYALLWVVLTSSLVAMLLQTMSARLGIATGQDLAAASREAWPRAAGVLWASAEIAIVATDLAEVLGSALALQLLFHVPLALGVVLTGLDVGVLLLLDRRGSRALERLVASLLFVVTAGFAYELVLSHPQTVPLLRGLLPDATVVRAPGALYTAVGILGATVMPHNLYLHSGLVRARVLASPGTTQRECARYATVDTVVSLGGAMLLNGALVVLAAAVFHHHGHASVGEIADAHRLLAPLLGSVLAPIVFAVALLAAGQSATITGTLAGQIVMQGYLQLRWPAWKRRLVTRACAMVPALLIVALAGESSTGRMLVGSQVVLSLQLPCAMVPLVLLTSNATRMGALVNRPWMRALAWLSVVAVLCANVALLVMLARGS